MVGIYFSGTGNTKFCVTRFLEKCGGKAYSIEDEAVTSALSEDNEIVLGYPVYYSDLPKIMRDFIEQNAELWRGKNVFIIATMGLFSGDGAGVSARLLKKHGAVITGGLHVKMPDCIGDVKTLKKSPEENWETVRLAAQKLDEAAKKLQGGKPPREGLGLFYHIAGLFGQRLWFYGKTKRYTQNPKIDRKQCVGCGACVRLCPMENITLRDRKAVSGSRCTMCYRCFSNCPRKAITIIGKRVIVQYKFIDSHQKF